MSLDTLYQEIIIDHYKSPRCYGKLDPCDLQGHDHNPFCGDELTVYARLEGDTLKEISFEGKGCSISQASASMMTQILKEKSLKEALLFSSKLRALLRGEEEMTEEELEDLNALRGVANFPVRVKCATLAWNILQKAIIEHVGKSEKTPSC